MPFSVANKEHPDHIVTLNAVDDPEFILLSCSCGEDMSLPKNALTFSREGMQGVLDVIVYHLHNSDSENAIPEFRSS